MSDCVFISPFPGTGHGADHKENTALVLLAACVFLILPSNGYMRHNIKFNIMSRRASKNTQLFGVIFAQTEVELCTPSIRPLFRLISIRSSAVKTR
jgi:hypothetical protein